MITLFSRVQIGKHFQYMGRQFEKTGEKRAKTGTALWVFEGREKVDVVDETVLTNSGSTVITIEQYLPYEGEDSD